jgi:hypothetical protein
MVELEKKSQKYYNESIFKVFGIDLKKVEEKLFERKSNTSFFSFKEKQLNNVLIERQKLTNKPTLRFNRDGKIITYL